MIILVCGSRKYSNESILNFSLEDFERVHGKIKKLIQGGATGADSLAAKWARSCGIEVIEVRASWQLFGIAAGPIRNQKMLEYKPDYVIAFNGGRGTQDMVLRAKRSGIPTIQVDSDNYKKQTENE